MSDDPYQSDDSSSEEKEKTTTKTNATTSENVTPEIFDSSTYDSITEIKESATMDENDTKKVLADTEKLELIQPETTSLETTDNNNTNANVPTVNPTMEEHAAALKQSRENKGRQNIKQKEVPLTALSKKLEKQSTQINKIMQMLQPVHKQIKSAERQQELIKHLQSQLKQLQKQVSLVQKEITKNRKK